MSDLKLFLHHQSQQDVMPQGDAVKNKAAGTDEKYRKEKSANTNVKFSKCNTRKHALGWPILQNIYAFIILFYFWPITRHHL